MEQNATGWTEILLHVFYIIIIIIIIIIIC